MPHVDLQYKNPNLKGTYATQNATQLSYTYSVTSCRVIPEGVACGELNLFIFTGKGAGLTPTTSVEVGVSQLPRVLVLISCEG